MGGIDATPLATERKDATVTLNGPFDAKTTQSFEIFPPVGPDYEAIKKDLTFKLADGEALARFKKIFTDKEKFIAGQVKMGVKDEAAAKAKLE